VLYVERTSSAYSDYSDGTNGTTKRFRGTLGRPFLLQSLQGAVTIAQIQCMLFSWPCGDRSVTQKKHLHLALTPDAYSACRPIFEMPLHARRTLADRAPSPHT